MLPPCESLYNARFLGPQSPYLKRRLDQFSRVCRAHCRNQQTHEHTHTQTTQLRSNSPHYHAMHAMRPKIIAVNKLLQQIGSQRPHRCCPWGIKLSPEYLLRASLDKCDPPQSVPFPSGIRASILYMVPWARKYTPQMAFWSAGPLL